MGGEGRLHKTEYNDEDDLAQYRLNLSETQFDEVASKLGLPKDEKEKLRTGTDPAPSDGELMLTYRGRYVRLTYKKGKIDKITPPDLKY